MGRKESNSIERTTRRPLAEQKMGREADNATKSHHSRLEQRNTVAVKKDISIEEVIEAMKSKQNGGK